jgi:NAD(P)-dependent dehydrogenase (short-subunit alcohol dehydrogenase family)
MDGDDQHEATGSKVGSAVSNRFEGKVSIVTGAASGIGREICLGLLAEGATVIANDINEEGLGEVCSDVNAHAVSGDTSVPETAERLVAKALEVSRRVDLLVNNAGIGLPGPTENLTNERWQRCIDVNLTGYFFLARDAGRVMIDQRSGVILNVASMAGLAGVPENIGYVASKHGVVGLTRSLAVDWARYGIRVNALCPGITETALIRQREAEAPEMFRARKERIPLGRVAQPVEQSRVGLFLLSDDASYVSGLVANVDAGGFALYSGFVAPKIAN